MRFIQIRAAEVTGVRGGGGGGDRCVLGRMVKGRLMKRNREKLTVLPPIIHRSAPLFIKHKEVTC